MLEYLEKACLVHIWNGVLFVHGGATACALGWNIKLAQQRPANNSVFACNGARISALMEECCECACSIETASSLLVLALVYELR